jgi:hypothetical protein
MFLKLDSHDQNSDSKFETAHRLKHQVMCHDSFWDENTFQRNRRKYFLMPVGGVYPTAYPPRPRDGKGLQTY